jgi:predicted nucleic acid-binding protein
MIMCDTNIFIRAFNEMQDTIDQLQLIGYENIVLSSITVMELFQGMGNKKELAAMKKKIRYYDVVQFDADVSKKAVELMENYKLSHGLKIPDAIIGATSIVHDIMLFTYNLKDFDYMPSIKLYKPK